MTTKTGPSYKALPTPRSVTYVISYSGVSALDMMVQMRSSQKCLIAVIVCTFEEPFVIMRTKMLLEASWAIEGLCASVERAAVSL